MRESQRPELSDPRQRELLQNINKYVELVGATIRWMRKTAQNEPDEQKAAAARGVAEEGNSLINTIADRATLQESDAVAFIHAAKKFIGERSLDADVLETPHITRTIIADGK